MMSVGELKRLLRHVPDNTPIMIDAGIGGYYPLEEDPAVFAVCYQGNHAEGGEWELRDKAKEGDRNRGSIEALLIG